MWVGGSSGIRVAYGPGGRVRVCPESQQDVEVETGSPCPRPVGDAFSLSTSVCLLLSGKHMPSGS